MIYRFSGAKDVKGFLEEVDKVVLCTDFGGWDKMQADYKSGNVGPEFLWTYYELAGENNKPKVFNQYLQSLPDEKLFTVEVGKMLGEDMVILYDYELMKRMVEGRVRLREQAEDFDSFFTFGLQRMLTNYIDESINEGNQVWFEELLGLKKIYNEHPGTSDPDINMCWGKGSIFCFC